MIDTAAALAFAQKTWDGDIVPALSEYIRIPAKSPHFDADWKAHGHLDRAVVLIEGWCKARRLDGLRTRRSFRALAKGSLARRTRAS